MSDTGDKDRLAYQQALRQAQLSQDWAAAAARLVRDTDALNAMRGQLDREAREILDVNDGAYRAITAISEAAAKLSRLADAQAWRARQALESTAVPLDDALREVKEHQLRAALAKARNLNEPGELNAEYVRGQANLIATVCELPGPYDTYHDLLVSAISHGITVDEAVSAISELST